MIKNIDLGGLGNYANYVTTDINYVITMTSYYVTTKYKLCKDFVISKLYKFFSCCYIVVTEFLHSFYIVSQIYYIVYIVYKHRVDIILGV